MYIDEMLPEEIEQCDEFIREHRIYIQDCRDGIKQAQDALRANATSNHASNEQTTEWKEEIRRLEAEMREYEEAIRLSERERHDLVEQRRAAIENR